MTDPAGRPADRFEAEPAELSPALRQMAGLVLSRETVDSALRLVTTLAQATIPGTIGAGVTLVDEHGKRSRASSNHAVEEADGLQYKLDEGPCLTAWRSRHLVRLDDTTTDTRWPAWTSAVNPTVVRSVLSAALVVDDEAIGAIKVYSDRPDNYDAHAERVMSLFAQQAAILLTNTQSLQHARQLSRQLTHALGSRDAISRATGILMARGAADGHAAFMLLADTAGRSGRTVEEVAREVLTATASDDADRSRA
ncbi:GAF domain-containing protein [Blastococcus deserti]|uniref:GAF domain-containing protein n=1 Tax=Blastococcus deserti TaxID=2259033 RepID=A0ABW4XFJ2_9ACTN